MLLENSPHLPKGAKITPMLKQWLAAKERSKGALLLFRMGDFYELFGTDAEEAAPILELSLTCRDKKQGASAVPMAGFPHFSAPQYISKLIAAGLKVAICDQMEDPALAKGIVKRDVSQIVTPGTVLDESGLNAKENNYVAGLAKNKVQNNYELAALDLSTGVFIDCESKSFEKIKDEVLRLNPAELLVCEDFQESEEILDFKNIRIEERGLGDLSASDLVLDYIRETQQTIPEHIQELKKYELDKNLLLDPTTIQHLDLAGPKGQVKKPGTLLSVLDKTKTAMGGRFLLRSLLSPLCDLEKIQERQEFIKKLLENPSIRTDIRDSLKYVYDLERLSSRVATNRINPKELGQLRNSLSQLPLIWQLVDSLSTGPEHRERRLEELAQKLLVSLVDDPPFVQKEGGIFKKGYDGLLDELTSLATGGRDQIALIENREREATGISSLKIKYTRVFGYYIEVTNKNLDKVPEHYKRKQTVANGERFVIQELSELEAKVASAESKKLYREAELFEALRAEVAGNLLEIQAAAQEISFIDMMASFAEISEERRYVCPKILNKQEKKIILKNSRHPVVEILCEEEGTYFVPNDIELDSKSSQVILITGPNMGGKSTIMRQIALIQIMAQVGCFVPAESAEISLCDKIFTRVGASDDITTARSTFMVEMTETANILQNATEHSLVLLDEIGRGTSTFDGLSLAWSVAEHIHDRIKARTLFATHYHELTELSQTHKNIINQHVGVSVSDKINNNIKFLYLLQNGPAEQSYGLHVAELAGMPVEVLDRANQVLQKLENQENNKNINNQNSSNFQLDFFSQKRKHEEDKRLKKIENLNQDLFSRINNLDLNNLTPINSLSKLAELQEWVKDAKNIA